MPCYLGGAPFSTAGSSLIVIHHQAISRSPVVEAWTAPFDAVGLFGTSCSLKVAVLGRLHRLERVGSGKLQVVNVHVATSWLLSPTLSRLIEKLQWPLEVSGPFVQVLPQAALRLHLCSARSVYYTMTWGTAILSAFASTTSCIESAYVERPRHLPLVV